MFDTAFTVWGAAVSWLEVVAFILGAACVAGNVFQIHWAWPLAIASSALYAWLFFASKLYGDAALQFVFIGAAFWGWWQWRFGRRASAALAVEYLRRKNWPRLALVWLILWIAIGAFLNRFTDTDVPWWDAFPTAGSLIGQYLLGKKLIETWPVWVGVNAISIPLYVYKSLYLTAILYALFLAMAVWGWRTWHRVYLSAIPPSSTPR